MKIRNLSILTLLLILGGAFGGAEVAHASFSYSQTTTNAWTIDLEANSIPGAAVMQRFSTVVSGALTVNHIYVYAKRYGGTGSIGNKMAVDLWYCSGNPATYNNCNPVPTNYTAYLTATSTTGAWYDFALPSTGGVVPNGTYPMVFVHAYQATGPTWGSFMVAGNTVDTMSNTQCWNAIAYSYGAAPYLDNSNGTCNGISDLAIQIDGYNPGVPITDSNAFTHILRVNQPAQYATTTNTFPVSFDIAINASTTRPNAYSITYVNQLTRATKIQSGYLVDTGWTGQSLFRVATSSTLSGNGTYSMAIDLFVGTSAGVQGGRFTNDLPDGSLGTVGSRFSGQVFSVNVADNVQVLNSENGGWTNSVTYPSTSCDILANFGADFHMGDCVGLLITPASTTMAKFSLLTLANSFPFAYAYQIGELRGLLFGDATTSYMATTSLSVPWDKTHSIQLISKTQMAAFPLSAFIKLLIGWTFWFMLAELIYYQVIRSHDKNTPV